MRIALLTALLLTTAAHAQQSIVVNGSFEEPQIGSAFNIFPTLPGWRTVSGPGIEVQSNSVGWSALVGTQMVELDSTAPSSMAQALTTRPGGVYELSVSFSPRPGIVDNRIGVYWNGQQVAVLDASGVGSSNTKWQRFTYRVTATGTTTELRFADLSGADALGGLLDDVKVITLDSDGDGVPDGQDRCEQTRLPEPPPSEGLGVNHWALIDADGTFDTRTANDKGPKRTFTLQDTGGCSCTQIIEKLGLGEGHRKHGCSTGVMEQWIKSLLAAEELWLDSQSAAPVSSQRVLEKGKAYRVTMQGTFTVWGNNIDAGSRSLQPEAVPMFPSPKGVTRNVGADPEFIFAWSKGHALEKNPQPAPLRNTIIQVSLDGGKTWKHPATPDSFNAKEHKYTYELMGDGNALQVRINDKPVSDNFGRLQIFLLPGA